jgi:hypothetical protein
MGYTRGQSLPEFRQEKTFFSFRQETSKTTSSRKTILLLHSWYKVNTASLLLKLLITTFSKSLLTCSIRIWLPNCPHLQTTSTFCKNQDKSYFEHHYWWSKIILFLVWKHLQAANFTILFENNSNFIAREKRLILWIHVHLKEPTKVIELKALWAHHLIRTR